MASINKMKLSHHASLLFFNILFLLESVQSKNYSIQNDVQKSQIEEIGIPNQSFMNQVIKQGTTDKESQQKNPLFQQQLGEAEFEPRMEITSLDIGYNNETATLDVTVYVGIPAVEEHQNLKSRESIKSDVNISSLSEQAEKFTNYEIYLTAAHQKDTANPPSSCLSNLFLQHSFRDVLAGCQNSTEHKSSISEDIPEEHSCIDNNAENFTVQFRHVYSAYYCILIQPRVGTHTRRTFTRMMLLQTRKPSTDITDWQTTIDLQAIPKSQTILVAFTLPDTSYEVDSNRIRIDLMKVNAEKCNDQTQMKVIASQTVTPNPEMRAFETEFKVDTRGLYCTVVTPIDERCIGNGFWKVNGKSCARHSAKSVLLAVSSTTQPNGESTKSVTFLKPNRFDVWTTIAVICSLFFGLVIIAIFSILVVLSRRRRKQFLQRPGQLLLDSSPFVEPIRGTDSKIDQKLLPRADSDQKASAPISILLLYRRDDAQVSLRTSQLRKRLQSEYGSRIQVFDYGDEAQWEDIALEGSDWLPRRIYGSCTATGFGTRIVIIHSSTEISPKSKYNLEEQTHPDEDDEPNTKSLLGSKNHNANENNDLISCLEGKISGANTFHVSTDKEFLYGLQLLQNYVCENSKRVTTSIYGRVFNVRFSDLMSCKGTQERNQELEYPHLQLSPFTCYFLPAHYNQLVQHILSSE